LAHNSIHPLLDRCYRLLNSEEQNCLARMSVFRGGFNLLAVECLCGARKPSGVPLVEILMSLCEKSLLMTNTAGGSSRFTMLETIRQFSMAKLEASGDAHACKALHADYYLQLVENLSPGLVGSGQRRQVSELQTEMDNVRAALGWNMEHADFDRISRYLQALLWYLIPRAQFTEGLLWTDRASTIASEVKATREVAVLNDVAGWLKLISGDYARALPHFKAAHDVFKALGCGREVAATMITLGATTAATIEGDEGPNLVITALELCREQNDPHSAGIALIALGEGARGGGDMEAAAQCYKQALVLMRQCDDQYWMGALLLNMCHVSLSSEDLETARTYLKEAIRLANEYDYTMMINLYVALAGELALRKSNAEDAARLFGAATSTLRDVGVSFEPADQAEFDSAIASARSQLGSARYGELAPEGMSWDKNRVLAIVADAAG
jgi:tetratricopeptide (TPR) repeat protein